MKRSRSRLRSRVQCLRVCAFASVAVSSSTFSLNYLRKQSAIRLVPLQDESPLGHLCAAFTYAKVKYIERAISLLQVEELLTTSTFDQYTFSCSNQTIVSGIVHASRDNLCCLLAQLRRQPFLDRIVLVTHGHDNRGSPIGSESAASTCAHELLSIAAVKAYFVSQHSSTFRHHKLKYLPIGLGTSTLKIGLDKDDIIELMKDSLVMLQRAWMENSCILLPISSSLNLHGASSGTLRREKLSSTMHSLNLNVVTDYGSHFAKQTLMTYGRSMFVFSPKGTHHDCWRHYEALLMGAIPIVDEHFTLREVFAHLPVMFVSNWSTILWHSLIDVSANYIHAPPDPFFLTDSYWRLLVSSYM